MPFTAYDAGVNGIARARALLDGAQAAGRLRRRGAGAAPALSANVLADMRRLSVVMAIGALDTYMHRLILERAYTHDALPGKLGRLTMSFEDLLEQADEAGRAARRPPHNSRPRVAVKRRLRDRLLRETFQSYEDVSDALGMAGRSGNWRAIGDRLAPPMRPEAIKQRLNAIVTRRNQIVHEGDYVRLDRPQNARRNSITTPHARADIDFIAQLIDAIHAVV